MKTKQPIKQLTFLLSDDGSIDRGENIDPLDESNFVQKIDKLSPFDFINAINYSKVDLFEPDQATQQRTEHSDSEYVKFIINRSLSYFVDTIMYANLANIHLNNVPNAVHFDFYRLSVPRKKRFSKWGKRLVNDDIEMLSSYYKCSIDKAIQYYAILTNEQLAKIRNKLDHGGIKKQ